MVEHKTKGPLVTKVSPRSKM